MVISILIVSWNTRELLRDCLRSIQQTIPQELHQTIVVDNASSDGSAEMVARDFPWVELLRNDENLGFGRANNQAFAHARGEALLLLNPDTILHPQAVTRLVDLLKQQPRAGAAGPRILNPDGTLQVSIYPSPTLLRETWRLFHLDRLLPLSQYSRRKLAARQPTPVDVLMGACMLIRRDIIDQIGLFDEQFFVYSEEVDLCRRIQQAGWQLVWLPDAEVTHFGGQSTRQVADAMFLELYRNKVKFFRKHGSSLSTPVYKGSLYLAAVVRLLGGRLFGATKTGSKNGWSEISRQYGLLIQALPGM